MDNKGHKKNISLKAKGMWIRLKITHSTFN